MQKTGLSGALFAASVAGLAGLSFLYGNFAPLLDPFPWPKAWTYGLGVLLVAACVGLFLTRAVAVSAIIIAAYAVAWAMVGVRPIFQAPLSVGSWYGFSEALSLLVGVWTLYALHRRRDHAVATKPLTSDRALRVGRILFGAACLVYGIAHFAYAAYSLPFVPTWLPERMPLVYLTGACHTAAGAALILGVLPRLGHVHQTQSTGPYHQGQRSAESPGKGRCQSQGNERPGLHNFLYGKPNAKRGLRRHQQCSWLVVR